MLSCAHGKIEKGVIPSLGNGSRVKIRSHQKRRILLLLGEKMLCSKNGRLVVEDVEDWNTN